MATVAVSTAALAAVAGVVAAPADGRTPPVLLSSGSPPREASLPDLSIEELRGSAAVSRAYARPTPTPTPSPTPTPTPVVAAVATPTGPAPIVGTYPPVEGCAATVPTSEPPNGQLASSELCPIGDAHLLRADAAATYLALNAAYAAAFGSPIAITDSYRDYGSQARLYGQKPGLAARPGTSNHGWGVAVDVFGGIDSFGSAEHAWMVEHGPAYGWVNPEWAQAGGSRPEPWHWEFDPALLG